MEHLIKALAAAGGEEEAGDDEAAAPAVEQELLRAHFRRLQAAKTQHRHASYAVISAFHRGKKSVNGGTAAAAGAGAEAEAAETEVLRQRLCGFARQRFLRRGEEQLLDAQGMAQLSRLLQEVQSPPAPTAAADQQQPPYHQPQVGRCNYDDFCRLREQAPVAARAHFTEHNFLKCPRDRHGRINTADFFRHVYSAVCLDRTKITLHFYEQEHGQGCLREADLETYVHDLISSLPALQGMPEAFHSFYVFTAVRRFMFFLDSKRTGRISIERLVGSRVMEELMELAMMGAPVIPPTPGSGKEESPQEAFIRQQRAKNWFSAENALRVYNMYLDLDDDHNGLLSKRELLNYSGPFQNMRLTRAFIDRVYEESVTYRLAVEEDPEGQSVASSRNAEAEMDYKVFLDFVLAMENRSTAPALKWFFKLLDVEKRGAVSPLAVRHFLREVCRALEEYGFEPPRLLDVQAEIFDMARCRDPARGITWAEFSRSGVGAVVISMLVDVHGFVSYDQRENAAASLAAAAAAEEEAALHAFVEAESEAQARELAADDAAASAASGSSGQQQEEEAEGEEEEELPRAVDDEDGPGEEARD